MAENRTCPSCGAEIPTDAPLGLCNVCLFRRGLDDPDLTPTASETTATFAFKSDSPGIQIGPYKLQQKLGEGGMGTVWMARQEQPIRRDVALKVIKLGMDTVEVLGRFNAERQALALMNHPNIAQVLDAGVTETGRPFFAMELVPGLPITEFCDRHNLSTRERIDLFIQVCQGIQHAHQKGIIHRDIKPSNILVTYSDDVPVPKVIDFGIAKAVQGPLTDLTVFTALDQFIGTPAYMSPEQAEAAPLDIDTRSDIYSLGVLLYELLTGRTPFDPKELCKKGIEAIRKTIREEEPVRPSTRLKTMLEADLTEIAKHRKSDPPGLIDSIRGDLDWIVMKTLEKERTRRYPTANGLATDIRRFLNSEPVVARPPSTTYRIQKFVKRHRLGVTAAAVVAVALLLCALISTREAIHAERARAAEEHQRRQAEAELARNRLRTAEDYFGENPSLALAYLARVLRDDTNNRPAAQQLLSALTYHSYNLPQSRALRHSNVIHSARFSPDGSRVVTASEDGTAQVWNAKTGETVGKPLSHNGPVRCAEFSPDGKLLLTASADHTAKIWEVSTDRLIATLAGHTNAVSSAHFSADCQRVVTAGDDGYARIWIAERGAAVGAPLYQGSRVLAARFSPDAQMVITCSYNECRAQVWDSRSGLRVCAPLNHTNQICSVEFSPNGKYVATGSWDGTARIWHSHTGEPATQPLDHPAALRSVRFDSDGKWLLTACMDGKARVWEAQSGSNVLTLSVRRGSPLTCAEFSQDANWIVTASIDGTVQVWSRLTGLSAAEPMRSRGPIHSVQFDPTGAALVAASDDGSAQVLRFRPGRSIIRTVSHNFGSQTNSLTQAEISHDGLLVATASTDHTARIWETRTLRLLATLSHSNTVSSIRFSPDDKFLLTASFDGTARVWDAMTGLPIIPPMSPAHRNPEERVFAAEFSPDGRRVATGSWSGCTDLWDAQTGAHLIGPLLNRPSLGEIKSVSFSADGRCLVSAADGSTAQIWNAVTGEPLGQPLQHLEAVSYACFSADNRNVVTASWDGTARMWDTGTGALLPQRLFRHQDRVLYAEFSPDSHKIATASSDGTAQVWDAKSAQPLIEPFRHRDRVISARFSSDGRLLVTASWDGTARVWNTENGFPLSEPFQHRGRVNSARFSPAGDMVLTASDDGTARLWPVLRVDSGAPLWLCDLAEALGGQRLTREGWLEPVSLEGVLELQERLRLGQLPDDSFSRWLELFMNDRRDPASFPLR